MKRIFLVSTALAAVVATVFGTVASAATTRSVPTPAMACEIVSTPHRQVDLTRLRISWTNRCGSVETGYLRCAERWTYRLLPADALALEARTIVCTPET